MGSQLGFPTANIKLDYDLYLPKFGVYGITCKIDKKLYENQNAVKVKTKEELNQKNFPEAIYFKRKTLKKDLNTYHHIGVYCYEMGTLKDFVSYKQSPNEAKYKLEQLRALENKIKINVALARSHSIGIDTKEDFVAIKKIIEYKT